MIEKSNYLLALILATLILTPSSVSSAFENEPEALGEIEWGANINNLPGMIFSYAYAGMRSYKSKRDMMKIGSAKIKSVLYVSYKERFCSAHVSVEGQSNFLKLEKALIQRHGQPHRSWEGAETSLWQGDTVDILLRYKEKMAKGALIYWFKPIMEEKTAEDKQRAARRLLE